MVHLFIFTVDLRNRVVLGIFFKLAAELDLLPSREDTMQDKIDLTTEFK